MHAAGLLPRVGRHAVAGVSGFLILTLEFAAVRLFAPAFGQSSYIWSTVIGLILVALALGYVLGGRLGDRSTTARPLFLAHLAAGAWSILVLLLGPTVVGGLVPTGLPSSGGLPLAFWGGLVATLILFVPPAVLLGMTSPFLIRFDTRAGQSGRSAGSIYAVGTVGSLLACVLAPLVLLQAFGTSGTLLACALLAVVSGVGGLLLARSTAPVMPTPDELQADGRVSRSWMLVALAIGLVVTVVEFAAVRFMSPWFGQSNHVWANVIGVLMLATALGSWLGGRLADRPKSLGTLWGALNVAAFVIYIVAQLGPVVFEWLAPASLTSLGVLPAARWGSLAASAILLGPPLVLLGMATPFLVRKAGETAPLGRSAGAILAMTTVGGILGCILTPTLLVPGLGSRATLLLAGAISVFVAGWGVHRERRWGLSSGMVPAAGVAACLLALVYWSGEPLREHDGQIHEVESSYQTVRVVERSDMLLLPTPRPAWNGPSGVIPMRFLRHDEDAETFQSSHLLVPPDRMVETFDSATRKLTREALPPEPAGAPLTGGQYFEHMALGAHFLEDAPGKPIRVLLIGYAGGTVHRVLRDTRPANRPLDVLGVEIDPEVVRVADEHLGHAELRAEYAEGRAAPGDRLRIITGEDGRTVVNALSKSEQFDVILVDAYARTNYLPFQLASLEFFERLRTHLAPGGWIGVNVLGSGTRSPVAKSVAMTMSRGLGATFLAPNASYPGNVILWSGHDKVSAPRVRGGELPQFLMRRAAYGAERMLVRYRPESETDPRVVIFTDDKSPSDSLADEELGI